MGNCLSSQAADDLSLLNDSDGASLPGEPPPPYQEHVQVPVYHPTPSQTRLATQLTEEEQIRIAQRIGLIQHLPKGIFDPGTEPSEKKVKEISRRFTETMQRRLHVIPLEVQPSLGWNGAAILYRHTTHPLLVIMI
ncbi:RING finger protein 11a isoform X2 [Latimeria chalumnae]|uniref:RING finger protein 11a isoform X2 n=1 Tax=Latimeria chalumnae TaxID=7897 RepID=UPI0003C141E6|nr:PREDICTED: RING finger protein 11 isoform X2 [Latimeria chalumnae]|eukprot:XP_006008862.1 PREDICTED: RING finger protein 11 isoform X2 [Latimeria chalumnae]